MDMQYLKITSTDCRFIRETLANNIWPFFEKNRSNNFVEHIEHRLNLRGNVLDESYVKEYILNDYGLSINLDFNEDTDMVYIDYGYNWSVVYAVLYYKPNKNTVKWATSKESDLRNYVLRDYVLSKD